MAVPPAAFSTEWPIVSRDHVNAVVRVLEQGPLTSVGRAPNPVTDLEERFAEYSGTKAAVAVSSGTAALHLALVAAGIRDGDEVIVPALSFAASALAVLHAGARPVFVDIDPRTFNADPARVREAVTDRTRAIVAVHLHGLPADMSQLSAIAARVDAVVVEDSAQAHGASVDGARVGALGHVAATSFNASKNLPACGEGGIVTTSDTDWAATVRALRQFGERISADGSRSYVSDTVGWNFKINPMQAAFVLTNLRTLDQENAARTANCERLSAALSALPGIRPPFVPRGFSHVYHFFRFVLDPHELDRNIAPAAFRRVITRALRAEGVHVGRYQSLPLPSHPAFRALTGAENSAELDEAFPITKQVIDSSLTLQRGIIRPDADLLVDAYICAFEKVWSNMSELLNRSLSRDASPAP